MSLNSINPIKIIKDTYNSPESIAQRKARIKEKYKQKIQDLKDGTKTQIKGILKGHFRGVGSKEAQRIVFFALLVLTVVFGPFGTGILTLNSNLFSGIIVGVYFLILLFIERLGFIDFKHFTGIVLLVLFNTLINPLLSSDILSGYIGGGFEAVFKVILLFFIGVFVLYFGGIISGKVVGAIGIFTVIGLSVPYMIGVFSNTERIQSQQEKLKADAAIAVEKADLFDRIIEWVDNSMRNGRGDNINTAVQEDTAEYVGIKISDIRSLKSTYTEGEPVIMLVDFEGKVFQPTTVKTDCFASSGSNREIKYVANVTPKTFNANKPIMDAGESLPTLYPRVNCEFYDLPIGYYVITVDSYYRHNSSVTFPLRIMSYKESMILYENFVDTGKYSSIKDYIGGNPDILASSGPVIVHVANSKDENKNWIYVDPLIVDKSNLDTLPLTALTFQLKQSLDDLTGKIQAINEMTITLPEGIEISCDGVNNANKLPYEVSGDRWVSHVLFSDFNVKLNDLINCKLYVHEGYEDLVVPPTKWYSDSMTINVMYDYMQHEVFETRVGVI